MRFNKLRMMTSAEKMWSVETQVSLLHAMQNHKPIGLRRHFEMVLIEGELNKHSNYKLNNNNIWNYLNSLYNLNALNESERGEKLEQREFELPSEFNHLMCKNFPRVTNPSTTFPSTPLPKTITPFSKTTKPPLKTPSTKSQISSSSSSSSLFEKDSDSKLEEQAVSPKQQEDNKNSAVAGSLPGKTSTPAGRGEGQREGRAEGQRGGRGEGRKRTRQSFQHTLNNSDHYITSSSSSASKRNRRI